MSKGVDMKKKKTKTGKAVKVASEVTAEAEPAEPEEAPAGQKAGSGGDAPAAGPMDPVLAGLLDVGRSLQMDEPTMAVLSRTDREVHLRLVVRDRAGRRVAVPAWRVQYALQCGPTAGSLEVSADLSVDRCRIEAILRGIRSAALGIPMGGAYGGMACDAQELGREAGERATRLFIRRIAPLIVYGTDHITPCRPAAWPLREWCEGELSLITGTAREGTPPGADTGRGRDRLALFTAAAAGVHLAGHLGLARKRRLRYALWGFGRAGKTIPALVDAAAGSAAFVACADSQAACVKERGLDAGKLAAEKEASGKLAGDRGARPAKVLKASSDILFLAGKGEAFGPREAPSVRAPVIVDLTGEISAETQAALARKGRWLITPYMIESGKTLAAFLDMKAGGRAVTLSDVNGEIDARLKLMLPRALKMAESQNLTLHKAFFGLGLTELASKA
jgi:glutamate dehydrogenase/leucine dehydrogenase